MAKSHRSHRSHRMSTAWTLAAALVAACALATPRAAQAQAKGAAPSPIKTAADHATMAANAAQIAEVHAHMHHVLNCIEGKSGKDYDAKAEDPCQGHAALPSLSGANRARAEQAARLLVVGLSIDDVAAAHHVAEAAATLLGASGG